MAFSYYTGADTYAQNTPATEVQVTLHLALIR